MEKKSSFFGSITESIASVKEKMSNVTQVSDMCVVKIRSLLKSVDMDSFVKYIDEYKAYKAKGIEKLKGEELKKRESKLAKIEELKSFIGVLKRFSEGGEFVAPTDGVLDVAKDIAAEKDVKAAVIIVQVIQVIMKIARKSDNTKTLQKTNEVKELTEKEEDNGEILATMIKIAVSDKDVTEEEMEMLKKQAQKASVTEEELKKMIEEALENQ